MSGRLAARWSSPAWAGLDALTRFWYNQPGW
jgi:hypothetical protein